jgi:hypothetical protein
MCFFKKGLKKMQTNHTKAMSAHAEAIKVLLKLKEVIPKVSLNIIFGLDQLPTLSTPSLGSLLVSISPRVLGSANQRPGSLKPMTRL